MITSIAFVALISASVTAPSKTPNLDRDMAELRRVLGTQLRIDLRSKRAISYCPDNTCEILNAPASASARDFVAFGVQYFLHLSPYNDIPTRRDMKFQEYASASLKARGIEREPICRADVATLLKEWVRVNQIELRFTRQDEGQTSTVKESLSDMMKAFVAAEHEPACGPRGAAPRPGKQLGARQTLNEEARSASVVVEATASADGLMSRSRGVLMGSRRACPRTGLIQSWP